MIEHSYGDVRYLQFQLFQQFPDLIHGIFTRVGGYSSPPYASLNVSGTLKGGDNLTHVIQNRQLVLRSLALQETPCITLWNVHGAEVVAFNRRDPWRTDWAQLSYYEQPWSAEYIRKGDALITQERGIGMAVSAADCTPILLYDPQQHVIGVVHGGWRGTARGIVLAAVDALRERYDSQPADIYAGIGPAIGPCCYEVSEQVRGLFMGKTQFDAMLTEPRYAPIVAESAAFSSVQLSERSSVRLDLWTTTRHQLLMAGIQSDHIELAGLCTSCHKDRFFSHRAEQGKTGRFPVVMALRA